MSEIKELIAHLEMQKTTPVVDRLISKIKEQEQEITEMRDIKIRDGYTRILEVRIEKANINASRMMKKLNYTWGRIAEQNWEIERYEEEIEIYKEGTAGMRDSIRDLRLRTNKAEDKVKQLMAEKEK